MICFECVVALTTIMHHMLNNPLNAKCDYSRFNPLSLLVKSVFWGAKCVFKHQDLLMCDLN